MLKRLNLNKSTLIAAACTLAVIAGVKYIAPKYLCISWTPSLPYRVFFIQPPGSAKKYDYVGFKEDKKILKFLSEDQVKKISAEGERTDIKQIVCEEGDYLTVKGKDYYCNNDYIGRAKDKSLTGKPAANFVFNGNIPKEYIFVMGANINSLDSRYIGFIEKTSLKAVLVPII